MIIDKRTRSEKIEIIFDVVGGFSDDEIRQLLDDIRIVVEQRPKTEKITIIRL